MDNLLLFLSMFIVIPFTFEVIRILLEDKLDFDLVINRKLLRVIELLIALMLFPSAALYILCLIVYKLFVLVLRLSILAVDCICSWRLLSSLLYFLACYVMFLTLMIGAIFSSKHIATHL